MNFNEQGLYDFSGLSFKGRRVTNEDSIVCLKIREGFWLFAVADGVGGASHGEFASRYVINAITDYLTSKTQKEINGSELKQIIGELFDYAQLILREKLSDNPRLSGMKTTLSILLLFNNKYACGNIGDSPVFLHSDNKISKLVKEHTFNNETNFPNKSSKAYNFNVITRVVDGGSDKPDIYPYGQDYYHLKKGETIMLCSDGIYSDVIKSFNFYKKILEKEIAVEQKNIEIIQKAYDNKSTDNISVILIEAKNKLYSINKNSRNLKIRLKRKYVLLFLISLTIFLLSILLLDFTGYYKFNNYSQPLISKDSIINKSVDSLNESSVAAKPDSIDSESENQPN